MEQSQETNVYKFLSVHRDRIKGYVQQIHVLWWILQSAKNYNAASNVS